MLTIKQIQAFYWVARLGTLSRAAERLHITQSAATKRLQEVEIIAASPLFEGDGRKNVLTPKGKELLRECEKLLSQLDDLNTLAKAEHQPMRIMHVGMTELTALTWFPRFLAEFKRRHPGVAVRPEIDLSSLLRKKVEDGALDFAFLPEPASAEGLICIELGKVPFGWFAPPGTFNKRGVRPLRDLGALPVIEQGAHSIVTELCAQLWEGAGVQPERIYGGENVNALAGLISAGVGVSCLPAAMFQRDVKAGRLQAVATRPEAPCVAYHCCFLKHMHATLGYGIAELAKRTFSLEHGMSAAGGRFKASKAESRRDSSTDAP